MARKLVLLAVLTSPFWGLSHPLWEVDDARYAEVPREMAETGDWITPTLNYMDYVEKPPLIYWLGAASYKLFGVSEAAARLPTALLSLLGLLGVWWLGAWLLGPATGLLAAAVLGTCVQFFLLGRLLTPDMALSVCLLWATACILRCLERPRDCRWAAPLAWAAMGLGLLAKGLVAVLLPAIWTALLAALIPEHRRGLKGLLLGWGIPVFLLFTAPWFIAMELKHPGFFHFFFIEQHFLRFLTPRYCRPGPWYYFIFVDAAGTLPWTPWALAASAAPLVFWPKASRERKALSLWVAVVFLFFSASKSKLPTYILPLFAHQSLLAAERLLRHRDNPLTKEGLWTGRAALAFCALLLAAAAAAPIAGPLLKGPVPKAAILLVSSLALLEAGALWLLRAPSSRNLVRASALACAANAVLMAGALACTSLLSVRGLSLEIRERMRPGDIIVAYDRYPHGVSFYTGKPVDLVVNWVGELHYAKRDARFQARFGDDVTLGRLDLARGRRAFVMMPNKLFAHFCRLREGRGGIRRVVRTGPWTLAEI
jgi:4-amino-4-deoxy-L-arabinose transferase-like glycosyltransferase